MGYQGKDFCSEVCFNVMDYVYIFLCMSNIEEVHINKMNSTISENSVMTEIQLIKEIQLFGLKLGDGLTSKNLFHQETYTLNVRPELKN